MIKRCDNSSLPRLLQYFGEEYHKAIYLYIDLKRYGCETPDVTVFAMENGEGALTGLFLQYYDCIHCYSRDNDFDRQELLDLIEERSPNTIFFCREMFEALDTDLSDRYELHPVEMFRTIHYEEQPPIPLEKATAEDMEEIVDLLMTSEEYRKVYQRDALIAQMKERMEQGFARSYVLRENGRIVFHTGTVAEERPLAIGGMAILDESLRGRGLGKRLFASAYNLVIEDGFICFSNNMDERAKRMHLSLGYRMEAHLIKLTKIRKEKSKCE